MSVPVLKGLEWQTGSEDVVGSGLDRMEGLGGEGGWRWRVDGFTRRGSRE